MKGASADAEQKPACCRYKHTPRSEEAKKKLINALTA